MDKPVLRAKRILYYKIMRLIETLRGIDTVKYVDLDELGLTGDTGCRYEYSKKKYLRKVFQDLELHGDDGIIDLGSGKGSALIEFSKYPFARIAGVEYSPKLIHICRNNLKRLNIKNVDLFCTNVIDFEGYLPYNYIYLYNPFPERVFQKVINNIIESQHEKKREIVIIYKNPTCDKIIINSGQFTKVREYINQNKAFPLLDSIYVYRSILK